MTTDREQIIAAAKDLGIYFGGDDNPPKWIEKLYDIAFEAGRQAGLVEQCKITVPTNSMEQEFQKFYSRGFAAGAASRDAEIAELVADAARYRFLRKFLSSKDLPILTGRGERNEPDEQYAMDCVVDVAIAKVRKS